MRKTSTESIQSNSSNKFKSSHDKSNFLSLASSSLLRMSVATSLMIAMVLGGYFSYTYITEFEYEIADDNYTTISRQAIDLVLASNDRMIKGGDALALNYGLSFPNVNEWPNVVLPTFPALAIELKEISNSVRLFIPFVSPEEVDDFETFYYDYYASDSSFYDGIGQHSFGEGIFAFDTSLDNSDKKFHDTSGTLGRDGEYPLLAPAVQFQDMTNFAAAPGIMWNILSVPPYAAAANVAISCANDAYENDPSGSNGYPTCTTGTDILPVIAGTAADASSNPKLSDAQLAFVHPVYPTHNKTTIVGVAATIVSLSDLLQLAVPDYIDGIDIVISTDTVAYTYSIINGKPIFRGDGDKHDTDFTNKGISRQLINSNSIAPGSPVYRVSIYPSSDYYESYSSDLPIEACVGTVSLLLFCCILFVIYDYLMRWNYNKSQAILETKRRYVRFISHEVRTPLNIGMLLIFYEIII